MTRLVSLGALTLALAACSHSTPRYVVRLDLDRIAAQTNARDHRPGFTTLGPSGQPDVNLS
jgi:hypothetical protein